MRMCKICHTGKEETEFRWRNHDSSYHYCCRDCERAYNREHMRLSRERKRNEAVK